MRTIDISQPAPLRRITALVYGKSRSGKTRFAGGWPRPIFLSDAPEGGWETLRHMPQEDFFEPGRFPEVLAIERSEDMMTAISDLSARLTARPGEIQTVVVDSLTFYADTYFASLENRPGKIDKRQLYGDLGSHLRSLCIQMHQLPVNVLWLCLEKPPGEDEAQGSPLLSGQSAQKFPARCDYWFYTRVFGTSPMAPLNYEVRTRQFGPYPAGGRDGGLLVDPLPEPTYRALAEILGLPTDASELPAPPVPVPVTTRAAPAPTRRVISNTSTKFSSPPAAKPLPAPAGTGK
jgi:hypothetical protein